MKLVWGIYWFIIGYYFFSKSLEPLIITIFNTNEFDNTNTSKSSI